MLARIKKNDIVVVLSGKDKGKQGAVLDIFPQEEKVIVRGVAIQVKHKKAKKSGEVSSIRREEGAIHMCKVLPVCRSCKKPSRVRTRRTEEHAMRICVRCEGGFE